MGSTLQQLLSSLCSNTDWNYAVFWKLNHSSGMVLTLEDAYCANHEHDMIPENLHGGLLQDLLGLAVANMSYHVYSLGEGVVGQVAISGQHQWIFPEYFNDSHSTLQTHNVWGSQISAGIKTILVVAVGPCGVVQLGSLCKLEEDPALVTHIRHLFLALKDRLADNAANLMRCDISSQSDLPKIPSKSLHEAFPDFSGGFDKALDMDGSNPLSQDPNKSSDYLPYNFTPSYFHMEKAAQVIGGLEGVQSSMFGSNDGVTLGFSAELVDTKHKSQVGMSDMSRVIYDKETSGCQYSRDFDLDSQLYRRSHVLNNAGSSSFSMETDRLKAGPSYQDIDSTVLNALKTDKESPHQNGGFQTSECQDNTYRKDTEHRQEKNSEPSPFDALTASFSSLSGTELLEALGTAFSKTSTGYVELAKPEAAIRLPNDMTYSHLVYDSSAENLLDAVVASVSQGDGNVRPEISSSKSMQSLLTTVERLEPLGHKKHSIVSTVGSVTSQPHLVERNIEQNQSDICGAFSSIGFSSTCLSSSSDQFPTSLEMPKKNKKRSKPGESSRPRPRDRQLIQDRIKELRELVPNGSKCSIDSLLECTIKHMLFLQNVSKHADKLSKTASSKFQRQVMQHKETSTLGSSSTEQGSSWAVEVGGHLQVCSIMVENLDKLGMMLIEMLCEECSHFLEIANVIRSLELTILRGVTDRQGEKTWIRFVVEGQNDKVMHRMDILWSLVQIFQPKPTVNR